MWKTPCSIRVQEEGFEESRFDCHGDVCAVGSNLVCSLTTLVREHVDWMLESIHSPINVWHNLKLSIDCVHASIVLMFTNRVDKYPVKAGYTYNKGRLHLV